MILIVADAGPINYLVQIGHVGLLGVLAEKVVIPASVRAELLRRAAPEAVRAWSVSPPVWVEICTAKETIEAPEISEADREAIALAKERAATLLLMDDQQARRVARALGVPTMGTVGILEAAAARGLVSLPEALKKLRATSCFLSEEIIENALRRDANLRRT